MSIIRKAEAEWNGTLQDGSGNVSVDSRAFDGPYSFHSRFEDGSDTNPEELLGASLASCYAMALANDLNKKGRKPERVQAQAHVYLDQVDDGVKISKIHLDVVAIVPGIEPEYLIEVAGETKKNCPIGKALSNTEITVDAKLEYQD